MSSLSESIALVKELRDLGATRIKVGEIEVDFGPPEYVPAPPPYEELTPEAELLERRASAERLLYGSSE